MSKLIFTLFRKECLIKIAFTVGLHVSSIGLPNDLS